VRARDTEHLQLILQQFGAIPGVRDTRTTVVLTTIKESRSLPLTDDGQTSAKASGQLNTKDQIKE